MPFLKVIPEQWIAANCMFTAAKLDIRGATAVQWRGRICWGASVPFIALCAGNSGRTKRAAAASPGSGRIPSSSGSHATPRDVIQLCESGQVGLAVDALVHLAETQSGESTTLLCRIIQSCRAEKNLSLRRLLDDLAVKLGYESDAFVGNSSSACMLVKVGYRRL